MKRIVAVKHAAALTAIVGFALSFGAAMGQSDPAKHFLTDQLRLIRRQYEIAVGSLHLQEAKINQQQADYARKSLDQTGDAIKDLIDYLKHTPAYEKKDNPLPDWYDLFKKSKELIELTTKTVGDFLDSQTDLTEAELRLQKLNDALAKTTDAMKALNDIEGSVQKRRIKLEEMPLQPDGTPDTSGLTELDRAILELDRSDRQHASDYAGTQVGFDHPERLSPEEFQAWLTNQEIMKRETLNHQQGAAQDGAGDSSQPANGSATTPRVIVQPPDGSSTTPPPGRTQATGSNGWCNGDLCQAWHDGGERGAFGDPANTDAAASAAAVAARQQFYDQNPQLVRFQSTAAYMSPATEVEAAVQKGTVAAPISPNTNEPGGAATSSSTGTGSADNFSIDTQLIDKSTSPAGNWPPPDEFSFSTELVDNPQSNITASQNTRRKSSFDVWNFFRTALQITNQAVQTYQQIQAEEAAMRAQQAAARQAAAQQAAARQAAAQQAPQQVAAQQPAVRQQAARQVPRVQQQDPSGVRPTQSAPQNVGSGASSGSAINPDFTEAQRRCGLAASFEIQRLQQSAALAKLDQAPCAGTGKICPQSEAARQAVLAWQAASAYTFACNKYADGRYVWMQGPGLGVGALWPLPTGFPR